MANYNVNIVDGVGSAQMKQGTYSVTVEANGFDPKSLSPTTYTATGEAGSQAFTVCASGVLTLIFNETGAAGGTPITGGSVVMTDSTGTARYGSAVSINSSGKAVFNNVPYSDDDPYVLYFLQLESDDDHNVYGSVITVSMSAQAQTEYVLNAPIAVQSFTLTDENYGLPVAQATLTFTGE